MNKLYEQIPIETWKKIAYKVQRLKISDYSDEEFYKNLNMLKKLLSDLDICLDEGFRTPKDEDNIGLATLLHYICHAEVGYHYPKANFYEYIQRLSDLGIKSMEFRPVEFYYRVDDLYLENGSTNDFITKKQSTKTISKCYTDGTFKFKRFRGFYGSTNYAMDDLKNATYLLDVDLEHYCTDNITYIMKAEAYVKNFNSINFPNKDEFLKIGFPKLNFSSEIINWEEYPNCKQVFETFDDEDLCCAKRLTKTPDGFAYYKEYHNK